MREDFESYGVPVFYCNVSVTESAGGGNVRIWNCVRKRGVLIPVCEIIYPAVDLVVNGRMASAVATTVFNAEQMVSGIAH